MAKKGCICGGTLSDCDGHIVYDVYFKDDIKKYIIKYPGKINESLDEASCEDYEYLKYRYYFWLCDDCRRAHVWVNDDYKTSELFLIFRLLEDSPKNIKIDFNTCEQIFPININDYDDTPISDFIYKNGMTDKKYFLTNDNVRIYKLDDKNQIERVYELEYESDIDYDLKIESVDELDILIYTFNKISEGHEYNVVNGKKIDVTDNKYPRKEVHFMIRKYSENGSIGMEDPDKPCELYNKDNMDKFYNKYAKYIK